MSTWFWFDIVQHCFVDDVNNVNKVWGTQFDTMLIRYWSTLINNVNIILNQCNSFWRCRQYRRKIVYSTYLSFLGRHLSFEQTWTSLTEWWFVPSLVSMKIVETDGKSDGQTTDNRRAEKLIWAFSSGELKCVEPREEIHDPENPGQLIAYQHKFSRSHLSNISEWVNTCCRRHNPLHTSSVPG